jgi:multidrug resistance efflux pump
MKTVVLFLLPLFIFAKVHYAKVEPYETVVLKAAVSGLILEADMEVEGSLVTDQRVIHIDDVLDKVNLKDSQSSLLLLERMLKINKEIAESLNGTVKRQEGYYKRISKLTTASKTQKDNAYSTYISAKTQYLSTREKIVSLQKQIIDMKYRITQLEDTIKKKSIVLFNRYLYKLMVRTGDYVNPGTPLAAVYDIGKAKLVLFLEPEELNKVKERTVYIDGKKTAYKVNKVWNVADEKFISSYRAEIYLPAPKEKFSQLLKVELK